MKEKSGDRQSCGGKLLEGLEQVGDRSDSCFRDYVGPLCGEWRSHELSLPWFSVLPGTVSNRCSLAQEGLAERWAPRNAAHAVEPLWAELDLT